MKKITGVILIIFLLPLVFWTGCGSSSSNGGKAKWTFMVYMDGDNNLESFATMNFDQMKAVGSTDQVKIAVQYDALTSFTGTRRYYVKKNAADIVEQMPEQDMADPAVLTSFVNWAVQRYPADHYILVLWNHGAAWKKDRNLGLPLKGIISDDSSGNLMSIPNVGAALAASGKTLDIIGMDACLMAELEVAYQLKTLSSYLVFSEESEPGSGWTYTQILTALTANPAMTAAQLCTQIINDYIANTSAGSGITMSAVDNSKISALATKVNSFGQALLNTSDVATVNAAKNSVQRYDYDWVADLYHLANLITGTSAAGRTDANLVSKANEVKNAVTAAVIANGKSGSGVANSYGLTIYLPTSVGAYDSDYENILAFPQNISYWKDFIKHSYNTAAPVISWVRQNPDPLTLNQTGRLEAYVTDADGAADIDQVWTYYDSLPDESGTLNDSGTGYDQVAGDGIYTVGARISTAATEPRLEGNILILPADRTVGTYAMTVKVRDLAGIEDSESYNLRYNY